MVDYKVIKVSKQNYNALLREASRIQYETGEKATFDDAVCALLSQQVANQKKEILKFAGMWSDMSDEEIAGFDKIREESNRDLKRRGREQSK